MADDRMYLPPNGNYYQYGNIDDYGSTARYNQLQNYPNNLVNQSGQNLELNDREKLALAAYTRPNNISDMQEVQRMSVGDQSLFDALQRAFSGQGTATLQYANPIIENKDLGQYPQPKTMRPMVMTYDEYERQYMPYQYAEKMANQMHDNYDNYTQGINLDEYLDQLE